MGLGNLEKKVARAGEGISRTAPLHPMAYMAGKTVRLFLPVIAELLAGPFRETAEFTFVIGDLPNYLWAKKQALDPRIRLVYQHQEIDPWRRPAEPDWNKLALLEKKYGTPTLRRYITAQRIIDRLSEPRKAAYLQAYLEYFDKLWQETRPDVLLTGGADSLPFLAIQEVFKRNGSILLAVIPSRIIGRFHVVNNELEQIPLLRETFEEIGSRSPSQEEQELARTLRESYTRKRIRPSYYGLGPRIKPIPSTLRLISNQIRRYKYQDWYFDAPLMNYVRNGLKVRLRLPFQRRDVQRLQSPLPSDGRFFYYPLHFEPEFSIDILGSAVRDQLQMIRQLSSAMPARYLLYVKEHPNMSSGSRPLGFYRELVRLGNIRLLDQKTDGYDIISRCRGVVTISGTSGFEALFYGKPVLVLGRAFYDAFEEGVRRAGGYEEIASALQKIKDGWGFDPEDLNRFVVALYRRSYPGAYEFTIPNIEEPSNIRLLASGIAAEWDLRTEKEKSYAGA